MIHLKFQFELFPPIDGYSVLEHMLIDSLTVQKWAHTNKPQLILTVHCMIAAYRYRRGQDVMDDGSKQFKSLSKMDLEIPTS